MPGRRNPHKFTNPDDEMVVVMVEDVFEALGMAILLTTVAAKDPPVDINVAGTTYDRVMETWRNVGRKLAIFVNELDG